MRAIKVTESSCRKKVIITLTWGIHISLGM